MSNLGSNVAFHDKDIKEIRDEGYDGFKYAVHKRNMRKKLDLGIS
jgi:hypothetical protein